MKGISQVFLDKVKKQMGLDRYMAEIQMWDDKAGMFARIHLIYNNGRTLNLPKGDVSHILSERIHFDISHEDTESDVLDRIKKLKVTR